MSAQVSTRYKPLDIQGSAYFPEDSGRMSRRSSDQQRPSVVPLSFPATKDVLWDRQPIGDSTVLHVTKYRNISLHIVEKSVQLAYRHALQSDHRPYICFLIGSVTSDKDEEGITITIDRFDPGRDIPGRSGRMPTARLPGDHAIPLIVTVNTEEAPTTHSQEDFKATFKLVEHHFSSGDTLDIGSALSFRIHCCCYDNADDVTFNLHIGAVTLGNVLEATPINPVPIIPTALARNLTGPLSLSEIQGTPKVGYVTMDQTRKLLLLLESDPKACTLPLIGIWLSGLTNICSPFTWASCLRYMFNNSINDRVCSAERGFLLVMFSPSSRQPTFYECRSLNGDKPSFELVGCRENIHFYKHADHTGRAPVQLELTTARDGPNRAVFMEAVKHFLPTSTTTKTKLATKPALRSSASTDEDAQIVPRPSPKPLMDKSPTVQPSVPELSLIFDSFVEEPQEGAYHPPPPNPMAPSSSPAETLPHQPLPAEGIQTKRHLPGVVQLAQENQPLGRSIQARSDRRDTSKMHHVDTPTGRPGPLKPVNANWAHNAVNIQRPNPNVGPHAHTVQSHLGMKPKGALPAARNENQNDAIHREKARVPSNQKPPSDCTPRQKPPRPTSRKSEIMPRTSPLMSENAPSRGKVCAPLRRMSYPLPSPSRNQTKLTDGREQHQTSLQGIHHSQHTSTTQAPRGAHHRHPQSLSPPGMSPGPLPQDAGRPDSRYVGSPPPTSNPAHLAATNRRTAGAPSSYQTPASSYSHPPSHAEHTGQTAPSTPYSQPSTSPGGLHRPPHQLGTSGALDNPSHRAHCADSNLAVTHGLDPSDSNHTQSPSAVPAGSHPTYLPDPAPKPTSPGASQYGQGRPWSPPRQAQPGAVPSSPVTPSDSVQGEHLQPSAHPGPQGVPQDPSRGGAGIESKDAMVQLRRQEQLIQQLQTQIQMLLQAQAAQSTPPIPSGLMTPPATPTWPAIENKRSTPPATEPARSPPPATHSIATDTGCDARTGKTMHSMAVMTGKSLFWPDGTGWSPENRTSVGTSMTPQTSPAKGSPSPPTPCCSQDATYDPEVTGESGTDMTLPLQQTRDESQSTVFDVSAVDLQSFTEEGSPRKTSSPARSPDWQFDRPSRTPHSTHPETPQGEFPMDSLHSPVLGESASTCAPPGRRSYPGHPEEEEDDGSSEGRGEEDGEDQWDTDEDEEAGMSHPPVSLLYRDERQFYQNLLGKVERMLGDQTLTMNRGNHGDAMTTKDELGLTSGGPETVMDRSVLYRSICMVNSDFFPRINYVSLMDVHLDSPNASYEANAIAMKYLTEEELTQLSAGFKGHSPGFTPQPKVNPLLRSALTGLGDGAASPAQAAVDLSMASRKYMEKYGLLETPAKRPYALKFETVEETPAQRIVADNSQGARKRESGAKRHPRKTEKPKPVSSRPSRMAPSESAGTAPEPAETLRTRHPAKQHPNGEGTHRKPPQQVPGTQPPPDPLGHKGTATGSPTQGQEQPLREDQRTVDVKGRERKDISKQSGANILDIERLKQLPKLF